MLRESEAEWANFGKLFDTRFFFDPDIPFLIIWTCRDILISPYDRTSWLLILCPKTCKERLKCQFCLSLDF